MARKSRYTIMTQREHLNESEGQEPDENQHIPGELAVLPLRDTVIYPDQVIPLVIGRERSIKLVQEAASQNNFIALVAQRDPTVNEPTPEDLYHVGTVAVVLKLFKMPD